MSLPTAGLRRAVARWRRLDVVVQDLPVAVLLAAGSYVPVLGGSGTEVGGLPDRPLDALALVPIVLQAAPMTVRRRWPTVALALVVAGFCVDQLLGYHTFTGLALPLMLLSAGLHVARRRAVVCTTLTAAYVGFAVALHLSGGTEGWGDAVTFYLALVLAWGAGAWLRSTRLSEAARRRQEAEAARVAERVRIARDLHDVVTHHVTAMVVQVEAARYLAAAPERQEEALTAVAATGRRALSDLRYLLDVLNPDHDASRDVRPDIRSLVERTRDAGQPVELAETGEAALGRDAEDVAYRVVQEALTNALKYARGARTLVRVGHDGGTATVEVLTDGTGSASATG
ncbi:MAG: two-component sensor histidine kinase, partial [Nocardioides sp.]|nr:two-component sensor histidine kinase [Nocardioides sp.]